MTTYIIYSDPNDGYIRSTNANYATAQAGSSLTVNTSGNEIYTGLNSDMYGNKYIYQGFYSFDTSVIADEDEVIDAMMTVYSGYSQNQSVVWGQQFLSYNWTAPLTTASWRTQAQLKALPLVANYDHLFSATPFATRVTGRDSLRNTVSKTGTTKLVAVSNWSVDGYGYNEGVMENWVYSGNSTNKPYLTVFTTARHSLNAIGVATTALPDGTTIAMRSNGAASPVINIGYTALNGSWVHLSSLDTAFDRTIDGMGSLSMTSDKDGNFYVLGTTAGAGGSLTGQAYIRTGPTSWTAKNPLSAVLPQGNEQTVYSTAMTYMDGGTDGNDKACIYALASRSSGGNRPAFPYHVSGAGWTHDMSINVSNLKAGSGWLYHGTTNGFGYITATGIPAFVDMVKIGPNLNACYVQRGKFGNTTVGGIQVVSMYNTGGNVESWNTDYTPTGASQLVAISANQFAHVFDNNGKNLTVRFYNASSQIVGETSILASSFYTGVIGAQWGAYYDKVANLVRVMYLSSAGSQTLNRFDVSPVTFVGTNVPAVTTSFGSAGASNTQLRIAPTTDERAVPVEGSSSSSPTVTPSYNSTVGNIAPNSPVLTPEPNFDATSATTFVWTSGDSNPADYQTKYQLEISRVSDSVVVHDTGAVTSAASSRVVAANTLANGVAYRWRVRTYDSLNVEGVWSAYSNFSTAATGTLVITSPATDNVAGIETSAYTVTWTYTQSSGQTQTQRRVRVIRTSDSAVILDTGMQTSTSLSYVISGMESGREYRIEVSLVNSAAVSVPVVSRLITANYSEPMVPTVGYNTKASHIEIVISNPTPTGDRPEVLFNDIYKRRSKASSLESDFKKIATVSTSATYHDYAIKSGASYDYRVIGRTTN